MTDKLPLETLTSILPLIENREPLTNLPSLAVQDPLERHS